jgi:hypothetical protein
MKKVKVELDLQMGQLSIRRKTKNELLFPYCPLSEGGIGVLKGSNEGKSFSVQS